MKKLTKKTIELKGIELGSEYEGEKVIRTSLGGINGTLYIDFEDNLVYQLMWLPSDDGENCLVVSDIELLSLISGLENKFGINLYTEDETIEKYFYGWDDDDYSIKIFVEKIDDFQNTISVILNDRALYDEKENREQNEINKDF